MSTYFVFECWFESVTSVLFGLLGIWGCSYAYGFSGDRMFGKLQWNPGFRKALRWLAPLLVVLSAATILLEAREPETASPSPSGAPGLALPLTPPSSSAQPQRQAGQPQRSP